jgi:hypothetical protein
MLRISRGRDLVELRRARQFKRAVAVDVPTNRNKFVAGRLERPPDHCARRHRSTMSIDDATGVCVWRSRLTTNDDYGGMPSMQRAIESAHSLRSK